MAKAPVRHDIGLAETIGLRPTMEDTTSIQLDYQHVEQHGDVFLAVYDGHGGTAVSKWLAEHLHRYVSAALTNALSTTIGTKAVCATCGRDLSQMVLNQCARLCEDTAYGLLRVWSPAGW